MTVELHAKHHTGWWTHSNLVPFVFPGGEPHVKVSSEVEYDVQLAIVRHPTMEDLFTLAMWADLVNSRNEEAWVAMPYLPFARADREAPNGVQVFSDFIDTIGIEKLVALDPHSPAIVHQLFTPLITLDLAGIVNDAVRVDGMHPYTGVIAPDKGAHDRAKLVADSLGVPVYQAGKVRDFETGKLSGFECVPLPARGHYLLADDICDGGGTFNGLADHLRKTQSIIADQLDLWVSHGIFSKGFDELGQRFSNIFTTDSWTGPQTIYTPSNLHVTSLTAPIFGALA
jgi:ribose-phosphate pyrophosphokinase